MANASSHIYLRAMEPEDLEFIYKMENDRHLWPLSSTTAPYSHRLLEDYILNSSCDIYADQQVRFIIMSNTTPVGIIDLSSFNPSHQRAEVGIVIAPEHRQQGIAIEALRLLEDYALSVVHLHQLYAIVPDSNASSKKLFRRSGFTHENILFDWLYDGQKYMNAILFQKKI